MKVKRLMAVLVPGILAVAGISPVSGQQSVTTRLTRQPEFAIPFHLADNNPETSEVRLFVSNNRGRDWQLYSRQSPSARGFQFQTNTDGEYWFAVRTADRQGQVSQQRMQPELKVVVDTTRPQLDLRVSSRPDGVATVEWFTRDRNLAASSLRMQYRDAAGAWQDIRIQGPEDYRQEWSGQTEWRYQTQPELLVRAEVLDRAGNSTVVNRRIALSDGQRDPVARTPSPRGSTTREANFARGFGQPWEQSRTSSATENASTTARPGSFGGWNDLKKGINSLLGGVQNTNDTHGAAQLPDLRSQNRWDKPFAPTTRDQVHGKRPASGQTMQSVMSGPVATQNREGFARPQTREGIRPRISSSPNFSLEYDLYDVGSVGPRRVELWFTRDRGHTWELYGSDADKRSPFEVQMKDEGLYGYRLAVHGENSPAPPPPQDGEPADIWVGIDWSKPVARITRAAWTASGSNEMMIEWTAEDALLDEEPIALSYSESRDGPWVPIVTRARNSGTYRWRVDSRSPPQRIYLQLEVRDMAGNVSTSVIPAGNSGSGPSGRIRGLQPSRRTTFRPNILR